MPIYYGTYEAHQQEVALAMWAASFRGGESPSVLVWLSRSMPRPRTRLLLLRLMFPRAALTQSYVSCGNVDAFPSLTHYAAGEVARRAADEAYAHRTRAARPPKAPPPAGTAADAECCADTLYFSPHHGFMRGAARTPLPDGRVAEAGVALGRRLAELCGPPPARADVVVLLRHTGGNVQSLTARSLLTARQRAGPDAPWRVQTRTTSKAERGSLCAQANCNGHVTAM